MCGQRVDEQLWTVIYVNVSTLPGSSDQCHMRERGTRKSKLALSMKAQIAELCTSYKAIRRTRFIRFGGLTLQSRQSFQICFIHLLRDLICHTAQPIASKLCNVSSNCKCRDRHCKPEICSILKSIDDSSQECLWSLWHW
jgi:hypothetical protein